MFIWPALLLAPLIVIANLGLVQAAACDAEGGATYSVALLCFLAVTAFTVLAWREIRRAEAGHPNLDRHFLAIVATEAGALSALLIVAMWLPQWASACPS